MGRRPVVEGLICVLTVLLPTTIMRSFIPLVAAAVGLVDSIAIRQQAAVGFTDSVRFFVS